MGDVWLTHGHGERRRPLVAQEGFSFEQGLTLLRIIVVVLAYVLTARFSLLFVVQPEGLTAFWPTSGLMLAVLLLSHKRHWPALLLATSLANVAANLLGGNSLIISAGFALANSAESLAASWLVGKVLGTPVTLARLKEVIGLTLVAAVFSNALTALLGAAVVSLGFGAPFGSVWRVWWIADAIGMILVTPMILSWAPAFKGARRFFSLQRWGEVLALFGGMLVVAQFVFSAEVKDTSILLPLPYATFPFLLWAAVRFGLRGTSVAAFLLALVAVGFTAQGSGPFAAVSQSLALQVGSVQVFLGVTTLSSLMLAAVIAERTQAQEALRTAYAELEVRVQERTREIRLAAEELARSNAELEQFAYVASHDLQEPLRAVAGTIQLLQQRYQGQIDARADEFIAHSLEGVARMKSLITDLLAYSRVGTRNRPIVPTDCSVVMKEVLANLAAAIQESGAVVTYEALPIVPGDSTLLTQLFQNLIGNAIKFRGENRPEIHVKAERQGEEWLFAVRDNGIGIEPQYADRIFQVFQRLHTRRAYPGTGIGLAICKKIVERYRGRIWVESVPGRGSSFCFTYPEKILSPEDKVVSTPT